MAEVVVEVAGYADPCSDECRPLEACTVLYGHPASMNNITQSKVTANHDEKHKRE